MHLSVRPPARPSVSLHHDVMNIHCLVLLRMSMKLFLHDTDRILKTLPVAQGVG
jgi:hypothetical protein